MRQSVAVICTVYNEARSIGLLLDDLTHQTRQPDEVVVVDGGSRDGTVDIIRSYERRLPLRVLVEPGANISRGRNLAIAASTSEIIASTDAGVRLPPDWLESIVEPLERDPSVDVVSGFFQPDPHSTFETAMGATVLPALEDIDPDRFQPSSRSVAFRRKAWRQVGGYPEWLDYCEDLIFDFNLRDLGARFVWQPKASVRFRPRSDLRSFYLQYYRYARGDGKANLFFRRHLIRYSTYLGGLVGVLLARRRPILLLPMIVLGMIYCRRPAERLWAMTEGWPIYRRLAAAALIPVIRLTGDVAKMLGYPVGVVWRLRQSRQK